MAKSSYSFRLTKKDDLLRHFLEQLPDGKQSDVIRSLLLFAYRTLMSQKENENHFIELKKEIETFKNVQNARFQAIEDKVEKLVTLMSKNAHAANIGHTEEDKEIPSEVLQKNAQALLSSFGFE